MSSNTLFLYLLSSIGFSLTTLFFCFVLVFRQSKKITQLQSVSVRLKQEIQVSNQCAIGMGKTLSALQKLQTASCDQSKGSQSSDSNFVHRHSKSRVGIAKNLCREGASSAQMIAQLGLSKVEAELISAMNQPSELPH